MFLFVTYAAALWVEANCHTVGELTPRTDLGIVHSDTGEAYLYRPNSIVINDLYVCGEGDIRRADGSTYVPPMHQQAVARVAVSVDVGHFSGYMNHDSGTNRERRMEQRDMLQAQLRSNDYTKVDARRLKTLCKSLDDDACVKMAEAYEPTGR